MNRILLAILLLGVSLSRTSVAQNTGTDSDMMEVDTNMMDSHETTTPPTIPSNIQAKAMSTSVRITWDMVEGATGYQVTIVNVTDQNVQVSEIQISGLMPETTYTAMIKSTKDEQMSSAAEITFTTLLAGVQNLAVAQATETEIEVTWNLVETAANYVVVLESVENGEATEIVTVETTARFTGLVAITFYKISVTAQNADGASDVTSMRARTDGSGIKIEGVWRNSPNVSFGGQILVFRPLHVGRGSYSVEIDIPCAVAKVNVWNAEINPDLTDYDGGIIIVTQSKNWQREASEIGLNFEFEEGSNCTFGENNPPTATFNLELPSDVTNENIVAPVVRIEWLNAAVEVHSAGLLRIRLNQLFKDTNTEDDEESELLPKPSIYSSIIAISSGTKCPGGIIPDSAWSMSLRNVAGINGTLPGVLYFVQEGSDWYSNEAGLIYGYNPELCPDRSELSAEVMVGGDFVQAIVDAPKADM